MKTFIYQNKRETNYFEGWYFRFTNVSNKINYAVIFAITKNEEDPHSFIQVFDENLEECRYYRFSTSDFSYDYNQNVVQIGDNHLSENDIQVNTDYLKLNIKFEAPVSLETLSGSNSAMGYLSKAPLECFQEVIYLNGLGTGNVNNYEVNGKIYIEKTYGSKFPERWVWVQSNHSKNNSLLSFSVGKIPMFGLKLKGFLALYKTPHKLYRFYSGNLSSLSVNKNRIIVRRGFTKLEIMIEQSSCIKLVGPNKKALMNLDVFESLTAKGNVKLYRFGRLIFEDYFYNVGYEYMY